MTKREFLQALRRGLSQLPPDELQKQLAYYEELLNDMIEDGMTEQEATSKLGDPIALSMKILQDQPLNRLVKNKVRPKNGWTGAAIAALILGAPLWIPLLIALLSVALAVYAVIGVVVVVLFVVVVAIILSGIALIIGSFAAVTTAFPLSLLVLGGGLCLIGLGILAFWGAVVAAKWIFKLTREFIRWVKSQFIRKENV